MSNPDHVRIDCLIEPFLPRTINGHPFEKAFDNPLKPTTPTGLYFVGPLFPNELALYKGLDVFPVTRLGVDEASAHEAHEKLKADRAAVFMPKKAAPAPKSDTGAAGQGDSGPDDGKADDAPPKPDDAEVAIAKAQAKAEAKAAAKATK